MVFLLTPRSRCWSRGPKAHALFVCVLALFIAAPIAAAPPLSRATPSVRVQPANDSTPRPGSHVPKSALRTIPSITEWQWQLASTPASYIPGVTLYDVDLGTSAAVVADMHAHGITVACYFSAGTVDAKYPDAALFPGSVLGNAFSGFPDERWLDYTQTSIVYPLIEARFQLCASKGFDAVEADNVDGYANSTGFGLTYQTQIAYNTWLANTAHKYGLSIALKNDPAQVRDLVGLFDWSLVESCFDFNECDLYLPFIVAGKPVMLVEYNLTPAQFCGRANAMNFNAMVKHRSLNAYRVSCRDVPVRPPPIPPIPAPRPGGSLGSGAAPMPPPRPGPTTASGIPNPRPPGR